MIVICLTSIVLNFLTEPFTTGNLYSEHIFLQFLELLTNLLIISEVLVRIYSDSHINTCSTSFITDICILILCLGSSLVFIQEDLFNFVGDATCDNLFIFRSILFIARCIIKMNQGQKNGLTELSIRLYRENEEMIRRKFELAKLRYRYRPSMGVLFEEDEEESD